MRDLTNKIVHAKDWRWDVSVVGRPQLICISDEPERWATAEIEIEALAALCGSLIHEPLHLEIRHRLLTCGGVTVIRC